MRSVLMVCSANICRSPMAMGLFRAAIGQDSESWLVESAGVWAIDGLPAAEKTRIVLAERGLDINNHFSRLITSEIIREFDLVLVMESNHKEALRFGFPMFKSRFFLLSEMIGETYDIEDPIGGSLVDFQDTAREIETIINIGFNNILKLTKS